MDPHVEDCLKGLPIGIYRLHFTLSRDLRLTSFQGSVWRGIWGRQLRMMSDGERAAPEELPAWISKEELYEYFMLTPPPPDAPAMRRYPHVPHPYALSCAWHPGALDARKGEGICVTLKLFGKANDLLHVAILAFARAAQDGLGPRRIAATLENVEMFRPEPGAPLETIFAPGTPLKRPRPVPPPGCRTHPAPSAIVTFLTPLRLQHEGRISDPQTFHPYPFLMNLVRRYCMLRLFHGRGEAPLDFPELSRQAENVRLVDNTLHWVGRRRYSARQKREIPIGGVMGRIRLDLSRAPDLAPFLCAGQYIQAGKGTAFGLGLYHVSTE